MKVTFCEVFEGINPPCPDAVDQNILLTFPDKEGEISTPAESAQIVCEGIETITGAFVIGTSILSV